MPLRPIAKNKTPLRLVTPEATEARPLARAGVGGSECKSITVSMFARDIDKLDILIAKLRRLGYVNAHRSSVVRIALDELDLERVLARFGGSK